MTEKTPHKFSGPTSQFLIERERTLEIDIAALKQLIAGREAELETIRAAKAVRQTDG